MTPESSTAEDPATTPRSTHPAKCRELNDIGVTIVEPDPSAEIGAGILGPDPLPPLTDEERKRMSEGLLEVTAEFQAEHGEFTEEERAWARARLSTLQ